MKKKRPKRRTPPQQLAVGFGWYDPEEWEDWKAVCPEFEDTFEEWERNVSGTIANLRSKGLDVKKIMLELAPFLQWCKNNGKDPNGESRSEYV